MIFSEFFISSPEYFSSPFALLIWAFGFLLGMRIIGYLLRDVTSKYSTWFLLFAPTLWCVSLIVHIGRYFSEGKDFAYLLGVIPITWEAIVLFMMMLFFVNEGVIYERGGGKKINK